MLFCSETLNVHRKRLLALLATKPSPLFCLTLIVAASTMLRYYEVGVCAETYHSLARVRVWACCCRRRTKRDLQHVRCWGAPMWSEQG
ncbi:hypothetical protein DMENIID0001_138930 [Sergentomyia squamirostris]